MSEVYPEWFTPMTKIGALSFGGAEMIAFLAPPFKWSSPFSVLVKTPVASAM